MRHTNWSLALAGAVIGVSVLMSGCAGKSKATPTPAPPSQPAPPPDTLAMKVEVTPPKPPEPPPPPAPKVDPCVELTGRLASSRVHFDFDRANLNDSAVSEADAVASAIQSSSLGPALNVRIEGHCDATGSVGYNIALSERRAKTVRDRLVTLGVIDGARATLVPWGKQKPLDPAATPEAYAKNRRVEVIVSCPNQ